MPLFPGINIGEGQDKEFEVGLQIDDYFIFVIVNFMTKCIDFFLQKLCLKLFPDFILAFS